MICYPDSTTWPSTRVWPEPMTAELTQQKALAEMFGWTTLQVLSGHQIGICPVVVRPCKKSCRFGTYYVAPAGGSGGSSPTRTVNGQWVDSWCGDRFDCACETVEEVALPGPVGAIEAVVIDGITLAPTSYRVDNGNRLVRTDGQGWPYCQDMNAAAGEEGTFSVSYIQGAAPDPLVDYAAGVLANEFYLSIAGDKKCRLSSKVTAVTRQGVSYDMTPALFENGRTGIPEVDAILGRFNPFALKTRPVIASVDSIAPRRTTVSGGDLKYGFGAGGYGQ